MTLEEEIIQKSQEKPVVLDFWAAWCGPCQYLGPIIEELAEEEKDKWTLVKVNTEEHPDLASKFQIRGIPNIKIMLKGEVIAEHSGAMAKEQLSGWINQQIPSEEEKTLLEILNMVDVNSKTEALARFVKENPTHQKALVELLTFYGLYDPDVFQERFSQEKDSLETSEKVQHLHTLYEFLNNENLPEELKMAQKKYLEGEQEVCLTGLIDHLFLNPNWNDGFVRKTCVSIFGLLGTHHPLTIQLRRKFGMALS